MEKNLLMDYQCKQRRWRSEEKAMDTEMQNWSLTDELRHTLKDDNIILPDSIPTDSLMLLRGRLQALADLQEEQMERQGEDARLKGVQNELFRDVKMHKKAIAKKRAELDEFDQELGSLREDLVKREKNVAKMRLTAQHIEDEVHGIEEQLSQMRAHSSHIRDVDGFAKLSARLRAAKQAKTTQDHHGRKCRDEVTLLESMMVSLESRQKPKLDEYDELKRKSNDIELDRHHNMTKLDEAAARYRMLREDIVAAETDIYKWITFEVFRWHGEEDTRHLKMRQLAEYEASRELDGDDGDHGDHGPSEYDKLKLDRSIWKAASMWKGFPGGYHAQWCDAVGKPKKSLVEDDALLDKLEKERKFGFEKPKKNMATMTMDQKMMALENLLAKLDVFLGPDDTAQATEEEGDTKVEFVRGNVDELTLTTDTSMDDSWQDGERSVSSDQASRLR